MLLEMSIRQFALIDEVRISFASGFNALTGETGAGKSILLDALGLIIGGRASADFVRRGADRAVIEALFGIDEESFSALGILEELGIPVDDECIVVTREITASGKTTARINGRMVTVQALRQIGSILVHMHGQHEQQALQDTAEQLSMIDAFGGAELASLRERVKSDFRVFEEIRHTLRTAHDSERDRLQRIDIVRFQAEELRDARLRPDEEEELLEERKRLSGSERLHAATALAYRVLYEGTERQPSAIDQLHNVLTELEGVTKYDRQLEVALDLTKSARYQLDEVAVQMRDYRDGIEFNPQKLAAVEDRLAELSGLRKKYGENTNELMIRLTSLEEELSVLEHFEEHIAAKERDYQQATTVLGKSAMALSDARHRAARKMEQAVMDQLAQLSMPRTQFCAQLERNTDEHGIVVGDERIKITERGMDRVQFLFSSNAGEPARPLAKIASGGELSRTMLAIKSIFAEMDQVQTLIFDEVDTGISGRAAQAVAERLAHIGKMRQVICVTHLPQVACMADTHFLIVKTSDQDRTETCVEKLNDQGRIEELARMLSGAELTNTTRQHAKEMLELANGTKAG